MERIKSDNTRKVFVANAKFAINLYQEIASSESGNFVVSPLAISIALAILHHGSDENTKIQLKQAMKLDMFDMDEQEIQDAFKELVEIIKDNDGIGFVNGCLVQEGFSFEEDFQHDVENVYAGFAKNIDFGIDSDQCCNEINQMIQNNSSDDFKDIVTNLDSDSLMIFASAAVFKQQWKQTFSTRNKLFFDSGQETAEPSKIIFYEKNSEFNYIYVPELDAELIEVPFMNDISLIIALPKQTNGLKELEEKLTGDHIEDIVRNMESRQLSLQIPNLSNEYQSNLQSALQQLGLTDVFDIEDSNFSNIDGTEALYLSQFDHKAVFNVSNDIESSESDKRDKGQTILADHPFMYCVRDNATNSILMIGRYSIPTRDPKEDESIITNVGLDIKSMFKKMTSSTLANTVETVIQMNKEGSFNNSNSEASPPEIREISREPTIDVDELQNNQASKQVVLASNRFAFTLYNELKSSSKDSPVFALSPLSIFVSYATLLLGANENTETQLLEALKLSMFDITNNDIHQALKKQLLVLTESGNGFDIVNGTFVQEGFPFEEEYQDALKENYKGNAKNMDFGNNPEQCTVDINNWINSASNGKLMNVIHETDPDDLMVVINAAIQKLKWNTRFETTTKRYFKNESNSDNPKTIFMGVTSMFDYIYSDQLKADLIDIPLQNEGASVVLLLPTDHNGLADLEDAVSFDILEEVLQEKSKSLIHLEMPKFAIDFGIDIKAASQKLGIRDLFEIEDANLSGIDGTEALYVSQFVHHIMIEFSENGQVNANSGSASQAKKIILDHPFLFIIHDNRINTITTIGRYTSPPLKLSDTSEEGISERFGMSMKKAFKRMTSSSSITSNGSKTPDNVTVEQPISRSSDIMHESIPEKLSIDENVKDNQKPKQKSSRSSIFFCCMKAKDVDFDTV